MEKFPIGYFCILLNFNRRLIFFHIWYISEPFLLYHNSSQTSKLGIRTIRLCYNIRPDSFPELLSQSRRIYQPGSLNMKPFPDLLCFPYKSQMGKGLEQWHRLHRNFLLDSLGNWRQKLDSTLADICLLDREIRIEFLSRVRNNGREDTGRSEPPHHRNNTNPADKWCIGLQIGWQTIKTENSEKKLSTPNFCIFLRTISSN